MKKYVNSMYWCEKCLDAHNINTYFKLLVPSYDMYECDKCKKPGNAYHKKLMEVYSYGKNNITRS